MSPKHGTDRWQLADYEWNEKTGYGRFVYRRDTDRKIENRFQPCYPWHKPKLLVEAETV